MSDDDLCRRLQRWPSQPTVDERLPTLTEFTRYWYGAPPCEQTDAPLALPDFLPSPLQWLYQTVAIHDQTALQSECGGWMEAGLLFEFNWLKHPLHIEVDESGFIEFVNENQCVCQWATTIQPDDPPVFCKGFGDEPWEPHMARLSDFLLAILFFELTYKAPHQAWGMFPTDVFQEFIGRLVHVDVGHAPLLADSPTSFYHGTGVAILSGVNPDGTYCVQLAARTAEVLKPLMSLVEWDSWAFDGELILRHEQRA